MKEVMNVMNDFMPTIMKYSQMKVKEVNIDVKKYDDGVILEIKADTNQIGDMLSEMMITIAKLSQSQNGNVNVNIEDNRK